MKLSAYALLGLLSLCHILVTVPACCQQSALENRSDNVSSTADKEEAYSLLVKRIDAARTLNEVEQLNSDIESLWSKDAPRQYDNLARQLIHKLVNLASVNPKEREYLLLRCVESVLRKEPHIPMQLEYDLVLDFFGPTSAYTYNLEGPTWDELRSAQAKIVFHVWRGLRESSGRDAELLKNPPPLYPEPPPNSGISAGFSPSAIKDPTLRKQYEDAIAENSKRFQKFQEAWQLKELYDRYSEQIVESFIVPAYSRKPHKFDELKKDLVDCGVDEQQQAKISKEIADLSKELENAALQEEEDEMERLHGP